VRLLVVEDEPSLAEQLREALRAAGFAVDVARDGEDALFKGETEDYDCVVLDLGLPLIDGLTVLKRWRGNGLSVPVIVLTARGSWPDKVEGIDAGADDYLAKPFQMAELVARVRALIRRSAGVASPVLRCGSLSVDTRTGRVDVAGHGVSLTAHEYRVLEYLAHHASKVVTRSELIVHIYAQDFDRDSNTIEVFIGRLRKKLGSGFIHTVRGRGYRLEAVE